MALDLLKEFEALATRQPEPRSLKELEATWTKPIRQRGRTIKRNRSVP
jgi:hypothetical protein